MLNQRSHKPKSSRTRKRRLAHKQSLALNFETLEARHLLAAITVGNATDVLSPTADTSSIAALIANDGGDGISLREAIAASNNTRGPDLIGFDPIQFRGGSDSLIRLTEGELEITDSLTLDATAATDVTITGDAGGDDITISGAFITDVDASFGGGPFAPSDLLDDNSRVLNFSSTAGDLTISGLTLTGGRTTANDIGNIATTYSGAGIRFASTGDLKLTDSFVSGNSTSGNDARGGGIATDSGTISLTNSFVTGNSTSGIFARGGGISTRSGDVSLNSSQVNENSTSGYGSYGGGIGTFSGYVMLLNSTVRGNTTSGEDAAGGGIGSLETGSVSLTNSGVRTNSTSGDNADGGGIGLRIGAVSLNNSIIRRNSTSGAEAFGGGVYSYGGTVSLSSSTVSENSTSGFNARGGGIVATVSPADILLTNSTVSGNSTSGDYSFGGGIYSVSADISLIGSTVRDNTTSGNSAEGGGIFTFPGAISLTNSTVSGNSSTGSGGGINTVLGNVSLVSSTVTGNSAAGGGGGISFGMFNGVLTLSNSIVAGNADDGTAPDVQVGDEGVDPTAEHSLIGDNTGTTLNAAQTADSNGNLIGSADAPIDPLLGPLTNNGGPTLTHALLAGSPAIDAGDNALAVDEDGNALATDQVGQVRLFDGDNAGTATVDIGAVEAQEVRAAGQYIFYNNSSFDVDSNSDAIALDKVALREGQTATFENYTSFVHGINGIAIDLFNTGTFAASDFGFRFGNVDDVSTWRTLDSSSTIINLTTELGAGVNGSDRVFIEFADGAITNGWLQVTVFASNNTGLTADDVFYFGNAIGESGNDPINAVVNLADVGGVRTNQTGFGSTDVLNVFDFNRDAVVNLADLAIARTNQSGFSPIRLITPTDSGGVAGGKLPPAAPSTVAGKYCRGKYCRGKYCRGKCCRGKYCRGKYCRGKYCNGQRCSNGRRINRRN